MFKTLVLLLSTVLAINSLPDRTGRIVGGDTAAVGQVPFIASLRAWGTTFHFAGGVLISNRWVLTVAHKVSGRAGNSIALIFGVNTLTASGTSRRSDQIHIHPDFDFVTMQNDLACIRLGSTVSIGQNIQPIFILSDFLGAGSHVQIAGWGATENDKGENSNDLLVLTQQTITNEACRTDFGYNIGSGHLCTSHLREGSGICTSDVGGPLIFNANLVGIASWHALPCGDRRPDVYTRISAYRQWITSVTAV